MSQEASFNLEPGTTLTAEQKSELREHLRAVTHVMDKLTVSKVDLGNDNGIKNGARVVLMIKK